MGVVRKNWFDRVLLPCLTGFQTPFLGTPLTFPVKQDFRGWVKLHGEEGCIICIVLFLCLFMFLFVFKYYHQYYVTYYCYYYHYDIHLYHLVLLV